MWHRRSRRRFGFGPFAFDFDYDFRPFGFYFHGGRRFPRREAYLRWLEEELKAVEEEIREVRQAGEPSGS
jgi:hypothetical protein